MITAAAAELSAHVQYFTLFVKYSTAEYCTVLYGIVHIFCEETAAASGAGPHSGEPWTGY